MIAIWMITGALVALGVIVAVILGMRLFLAAKWAEDHLTSCIGRARDV